MQAYLLGPSADVTPVVVAVGCAGGRHREGVAAAQLHQRLQAVGLTATLTHRDIDKPVVHDLARMTRRQYAAAPKAEVWTPGWQILRALFTGRPIPHPDTDRAATRTAYAAEVARRS